MKARGRCEDRREGEEESRPSHENGVLSEAIARKDDLGIQSMGGEHRDEQLDRLVPHRFR
jgi:hypothetical protein